MANIRTNWGACSVEGCNDDAHCKGLCQRHYTRLKRHGDPAVLNKTGPKVDLTPPFERVLEQVDHTNPQACWLWLGASAGLGYGVIGYNSGQIYVHRAAWEYHNGPIPLGMFICHHCDTPACVNPDHLYLGTPKNNTHDMMEKGRFPMKLSREQILEILVLTGAGRKTQKEIGDMYGITQSAVSSIKLGKSYYLGKNVT